jgi:methionyl-tRNA formyltransferase
MNMEEGLDTGAVFSRAATPIEPWGTLGSLHDRLARMGAELLSRDLGPIVSGALRSEPQPDQGITYASKIGPDDSKIDWSLPSHAIDRIVRAMHPVPGPGAFTFSSGKRLKIFSGRPTSTPHDTRPGDVIALRSERLEVACGEGGFVVTELQPEGKRRMSTDEFVRGVQLGAVMRFG